MAIQLVPLIKALTPIVASIASAAIPAFTSKKSEAAKEDPVLAQQIKELQDASTANAKELHALAEHLKKVVDGADEAAAMAKRQIATYRRLLFVSLGTSAAAVLLAVAALVK
ncbi:MAG: hypothetical protein V7756_04115 [Halopseudomonas sp.]|uniref:hypothetical protein n=1 Tax=Halopseudomonas sp. TaxID=2901191 RepID=UPI003002BCEE